MRCILWLAAIVGCGASAMAADVDFTRDVRPILADKCFACHGPDATHRQADLRLDEGEAALASGVILPGDAQASPLVARITASDPAERMPPPGSGKQLTADEIAALRQWIAAGAPYAQHWAYVPPRALPEPGTADAAWPRGTIDRWLLARWEREGLAPAPQAERRTLARRLSFDLTGLPLDPQRVAAFTTDEDPAAYERLVEELLASERYGERMAVSWLDLVRYADTVGYHGDQEHHAAPYRDYVIDAFNLNLPFAQFTVEQLAGDLLPAPTTDQQIATCYNRLLQTSHEGGVQAQEYLAIYAADRVRNLSAVWLGATVGCAQCHDHKYDPYTQADFYSLAAFFADIDEAGHLQGGGRDTSPTLRAPEIAVHTRRERERLAELDAQLAALASATDPAAVQQRPAVQAQRDALVQAQQLVMITQAIEPRVVRVLPRGNWLDESGPVVEPGVPKFLGQLATAQRATRLDLARWLTDCEQGIGGLTARVFVNRVWALFFGRGLSRSLGDLGAQGEAPDHPELLDQLALSFVESGWDVKQLVRQIVTSSAYRQSSLAPPELVARDSDNRLFGRQGRWRLPAEFVRDTALAASGLLDPTVGGATAHPYQPAGYYRLLNFPQREYVADSDWRQYRRGLYAHWQRQYLHPMLRAFDAPSREECTAQRPRSNTPLAALALLNDPTFVEAARILAAAALASSAEDAARLEFAVQRVLARAPEAAEAETLLALLARSRGRYAADENAAQQLSAVGLSQPATDFTAAELAAWTSVCRVLLNLSETYARE